MHELSQLGARLRAARQAKGWTLDELAHRAQLSASTLSRLESGKRQASLELLVPLTRELGVRIDDLLEPRDQDPRVHRNTFRRDGMTVAPLTREASEVRAYKITYHPEGAASSSKSSPSAPSVTLHTHPGHEWLYVLSGRLSLTLGSQQLVLERGEAAEFDTSTPHRMCAAGAKPAEVISIFNADGERLHLSTAGSAEPQEH